MAKNDIRRAWFESGFKHGDIGRVANKLNVSRTTISTLINDENRKTDVVTAIRLARVLGKRVEELWIVED